MQKFKIKILFSLDNSGSHFHDTLFFILSDTANIFILVLLDLIVFSKKSLTHETFGDFSSTNSLKKKSRNI